jgi:hypothetical protein
MPSRERQRASTQPWEWGRSLTVAARFRRKLTIWWDNSQAHLQRIKQWDSNAAFRLLRSVKAPLGQSSLTGLGKKEAALWLACAGLDEWGTSGAAWFLANKWANLNQRAGSRPFAAVVRVRPGQDQSAELVDMRVAE